MSDHEFVESFVLNSSNLRETADGYLVCSPRIARTGIQEYAGFEVGRPEMEKVRVYRPESEVMSADAMKSLAWKPVTVEHPDEPLTARNWKQHAVGHISGDDIVRDGEFVRVPMIVMDSAAIDIVKGGKRQLSVGYSAVLQWADGVGMTPKGEPYDCIQTAIRANHVAITHTARGGPKLRMGDSKKEKKTMPRTIMIDGISVEMEDRDAQVVERRITGLEKILADARNDLATAKTEAQNDVATAKTETANAITQVQNKDAEIATLKQQLADSKITAEELDRRADARAAVKVRAKALLDSVILDKKTDAEICRQVVDAKMGDGAKGWTDEQVMASFNTLAVTTVDTTNTLPNLVNLFRTNDTTNVDPRQKVYDDYDTEISNRWKGAKA